MAGKVWREQVVWDKETWQAIGVIACIAVVAGAVSALVTHWLIV